jgi:SpoVK/Ycf46/Vps4 family AAA+-type ATPase
MWLTNSQAGEERAYYASDTDHLLQEMRRLDLLIRLRLMQGQPKTPPNPLDHFRGLVLSDEEIARLLAVPEESPAADGCMPHWDQEQQELSAEINQLAEEIGQRLAASARHGVSLSLPLLTQLFHLTPVEEQCLLICLAPELDRKYEKLYAYLQDDLTRKKASADLVLNLLFQTLAERLAARAMFDPQAPLLKYRLVQLTDSLPDSPLPLLQRGLKLDDHVVSFLLGGRQMDVRLEQAACLPAPSLEAPLQAVIADLRERVCTFLKTQFSRPQSPAHQVIFFLHGPAGSGKRALVEGISHELGRPLLVGDVEQLLREPLGFEEAIWLLCREAVLQSAVLCLEHVDSLLADSDRRHVQGLMAALRTFTRVVFLLGSKAWQPHEVQRQELFITLEMPRSTALTRRHVWERHLSRQFPMADDVDWGMLASNFRLQPGQMHAALRAAEHLARWRSPIEPQITMADLYAACRVQASTRLGTLARKLEPRYAWNDIVLPADQLAQLRELCNQARYRHVVYGDWGFEQKLSRGRGLNALFSGPPGTGKTMAAEVIAHTLQLDLYQIDLSQVVSKYIGETEKNLHQIFSEAQTGNALLFFDEADALFGKRSEVKDAHDRYANIEVGYLLQKMEEYEGVAILATNLRQHLDEAFVRRMQCIVEFPFPDEQDRRRIWEVVFPSEAPLGEDVDCGYLAREIKLAGGNIKNIALAAAFYAAVEGGRIRMPHLVQAARREFQKLGRTWHEMLS